MGASKSTLEELLHQQIPLTKDMGVTVESYNGEAVTLHAPLSNNINHKSTAFGGSLYAICAVAGWALLHSRLQEAGLAGHIVIHKGEITYHKPVKGDFTIMCSSEYPEQINTALEAFQDKGRARLWLTAHVLYNNETAVEFKGSFVIHN